MYNATALKRDANGTLRSVEAVCVEAGLVVRAAGFWSHLNGKAAFDAAWRNAQFSFVYRIEIREDLDPTDAYKMFLAGVLERYECGCSRGEGDPDYCQECYPVESDASSIEADPMQAQRRGL